MLFKDPLYEEVHRRLMAQNKLDHQLTKRILDKLVCVYEIPEEVVISKSTATVAEAFGFYEHAMGGSGVSSRNYDKYKFAGVEVGNVTFGMLIPTAPHASGQLNLYVEVPTTIRSRGLLLKAQDVEPTEISGRSTEGEWKEKVDAWAPIETDADFRIRFVYEDGDKFFWDENVDRCCIYLHEKGFKSMPGEMILDDIAYFQDKIDSHQRHGLKEVVIETFMPGQDDHKLSLTVHQVVVENSYEEQRVARMQRNLERLVNVLRIFPRD